MSRSRMLSELFLNRQFLGVLSIKVVLGTLFASYYMRDLFTPFVSYFVESGFENPWAFFHGRGELKVFPYSPVMLVVLAIPRALADTFLPDSLLSDSWATVSFAHLFVMRIPLILADIGIYATLAGFMPHRVARVRALYWCSPIVIYITYWHGQLDIIPTCFLVLSVFCTVRRREVLGAVLLGLGVAAKSHILVAAPFLAMYLWRQRSVTSSFRFLLISGAVYLACLSPVLGSPAFREMVLAAKEQSLVFALVIPFSENVSLYVTPAVLLLLVLRFGVYKKQNADLLLLFLSITFCVFVLLVPPMPAWYLWTLPFVAYAYAGSSRASMIPYQLFALSYLVYFLLGPHSDLIDSLRLVAPSLSAHASLGELVPALSEDGVFGGLAFTAMQTSLVVIIVNVYQFGVKSNEIYQIPERPTLIGIAGDSASGKDTVVDLLADALGSNSVAKLAGDDYHRWPRGHEKWHEYTHLDQRSNELEKMVDDAAGLGECDSIQKVEYDHETGQFTELQTVDPRNYVIFQGLHTLVIERMRDMLDLRIFLDPDESLRVFWKVRRDTECRGKSRQMVLNSLREREQDREQHILPQRDFADVVYRLVPATAGPLRGEQGAGPCFDLEVIAKNSFHIHALARHLVGVSELKVTDRPLADLTHDSLRISGRISAEEVHGIALEAVPNLSELTRGHSPRFYGDHRGLMQLLSLHCISKVRQWSRRSATSSPDGVLV